MNGVSGQPVLSIRDLYLGFRGYTGYTEVLHGITLSINRGQRVALVGESGSGKSVTARIVLGLLQENRNAKIKGDVIFQGTDISSLNSHRRRALRGTEMSMIFQDPTSALNPVFTIGYQFHEVLRRVDDKLSEDDAYQRAAELLQTVSIPDPARVLDAYSFQLSGGMNQRVIIAMALAMHDMVSAHNTAVLLISHNLGVVREFADQVYVIYRGRIVEQGSTRSVFESPGHAYTRALMSAVPRVTGGGIPDIDDESADFLDPCYVHDDQPSTGYVS